MIVRRKCTAGGPLITATLVMAGAMAQQPTPVMTTLYNFQGNISGDGMNPQAPLVKGSGGVFYGTACNGGSTQVLGAGTVYSLTPPGAAGGAWTEKTLFAFNIKDGTCPNSPLAVAGDGVLYGTTPQGGSASQQSYGTVFSLTPPATPGGAWTERIVHAFTGSADGGGPTGVVFGPHGVLYGSAQGGSMNSGNIFSLRPPSSAGGSWTKELLYTFTGGNDGYGPSAVVIGPNGVLYGTTQIGGAANSGLVFSLTPPSSPGKPWTQTVLYTFGATEGNNPEAGVVVGNGGVLYGTTFFGSVPGLSGTVFSLTPPAAPGGAWTKAVLHTFNYTDGASPNTPLIIGRGGVLYGTAPSGGTSGGPCPQGCGTLYWLTPPAMPGGAWTTHTFDFGSTYPAGYPPSSALLLVSGQLLGVTAAGGSNTCGTIYSFQP